MAGIGHWASGKSRTTARPQLRTTMIDLDEQLNSGPLEWPVKIGGAVVFVVHPSRATRAAAPRGGVIGLATRALSIAAKVIGISTAETAMRADVLAHISPRDAEGRAAVRRMGLYHLGSLYAYIQRDAIERMSAVAPQRPEPPEAPATPETAIAADTMPPIVPRSATAALKTGHELSAGGGHLPGQIGGGLMWGKAAIDAAGGEAAWREKIGLAPAQGAGPADEEDAA